MPTNTAARIPKKHARLVVDSADYTRPEPDQIVVRNRAIAINPLDWITQVEGNITYGWLKYPTVLGSDVAGEVVEVGSAVTRFHIGDRVLGHAVGTDKDSKKAAEGAFQEYTVLFERMASSIPDELPFEEAATLPLAVSTASCALFQDDQLNLKGPGAHPVATGSTVLVWGGATSVGSQAIQLAVAAGYEVISTASPKNFGHVKALGATTVFDYNSPTVEGDIIAAFAGRRFAGAAAFGRTAAAACVRIASACEGNRFVAIASPSVDFSVLASGGLGTRIGLTLRLIRSTMALQAAARRGHVKTNFVVGTTLKKNNVSSVIYRDFLPAALAHHRYQISPKPVVVGHGLESIQDAMDTQRDGVSASKLVITL